MNSETIWALAGVVLIIADLLFGSFFILFVGAAALITSLLVLLGILPDPTWQWVVFATVSTLGLLLFRNKLVRFFGKGAQETFDEHKGQRVLVTETIPAHGNGHVMYRGVKWYAKSKDGSSIEEGNYAIVQYLDGITLIVVAE